MIPHSRKKVVIPDSVEIETKETSKIEEMSGKLDSNPEEQRLMRSVMENDENIIDKGKLISDAINQGFSSFTPDMTFDNLSKNFSMAKNIYGEKLLRLITGYEAQYIDRNIKIPEFQRELKSRIKENIDQLKKEKLLKKDGTISDSGLHLASLIMYTEELDKLIPKGFSGEKIIREKSVYGMKDDVKDYRKGDRFRDIDIRKTLKRAIRRGRNALKKEDLKINERVSKGSIYVVYAIDSSGSMKGKKIESAKKAGIALAFKAIERKDKVGLIVFGTEVENKVEPTEDFMKILKEITGTKALKETNLAGSIKEALTMFPQKHVTKHVVLITDAVPTIGKNPEKETLETASMARDAGITISLIGIDLDDKGKKLAEEMTKIGNGRLYVVKGTEKVDQMILEDYYSIT